MWPKKSSTLSPKIQRKSMLPAMCATPECRNKLVTNGRNAPTKSMFPARKAGKRAGMVALAIRKALAKCGGSVISCRKTAMFAQISRTLTIGNRRCGLRSLSGMNTKSRGQSNQNRQKDKALRMLVKAVDRRSFHAKKQKYFLISENRELTRQFGISVRDALRARCGCDI